QGLESRIVTHKSDTNRIGLSEKVDFALAFYMVHEVPNAETFLKEIVSVLKPKEKLLIVEPMFHVSATAFAKTIEVSLQAGLRSTSEPKIRFCRSKLFELGGRILALIAK
ncbi:MAG: class I SAM-dependent methyltransferase, partial [Methanothrix sp.]|nr:class I SAM-dependent methyltransferase [Methanothrix sp.]